MILYLCVFIMFSLHRESLKLILATNPFSKWFCHTDPIYTWPAWSLPKHRGQFVWALGRWCSPTISRWTARWCFARRRDCMADEVVATARGSDRGRRRPKSNRAGETSSSTATRLPNDVGYRRLTTMRTHSHSWTTALGERYLVLRTTKQFCLSHYYLKRDYKGN
jgi:hypothetical protein